MFIAHCSEDTFKLLTMESNRYKRQKKKEGAHDLQLFNICEHHWDLLQHKDFLLTYVLN